MYFNLFNLKFDLFIYESYNFIILKSRTAKKKNMVFIIKSQRTVTIYSSFLLLFVFDFYV